MLTAFVVGDMCPSGEISQHWRCVVATGLECMHVHRKDVPIRDDAYLFAVARHAALVMVLKRLYGVLKCLFAGACYFAVLLQA